MIRGPMLHLKFHHGVLAHLVSSGLWDIIDANQLGLVPHTIPLKPAQQVLICLFWDCEKRNKKNWFLQHETRKSWNEIVNPICWSRHGSNPIFPSPTFLLLFLERDLGRGRSGGRGVGCRGCRWGRDAGIGRDGRAVLHLCRHGAEWASLVKLTVGGKAVGSSVFRGSEVNRTDDS